MSGFIIWYTDQSYGCGAGLDGDIYDTKEDAEAAMWVTNRDTPRYTALPYVECAEGQEESVPSAEQGYQSGFYQTGSGQPFHVLGRDMSEETMNALKALAEAALKQVERGELPGSKPATEERVAALMDEVSGEIALDQMEDHPMGKAAHAELYRGYVIGVWQTNTGQFYAEIDNGNVHQSGAAQGLYGDLESAVNECKRMIDDPYDEKRAE